MKASFYTTLFYVVSTTPALMEYLNLPELKPIEAQAWSAVILSSGLVYGTYANRWIKASSKKLTRDDDDNEKKTEDMKVNEK